MNTIKYRALAKDGTWRYGEYPHFAPEMSNTHYPMDVFWKNFLAAFRRETLGQWTGLLDKQGREIYEGDIVQTKAGDSGFFRYQVIWSKKESGWRDQYEKKLPKLFGKVEYEIAGNIYENPKRLGLAG